MDVTLKGSFRAQELCESRGGRPGRPVPNSLYGLCGCNSDTELELAVRAARTEVFVLAIKAAIKLQTPVFSLH